MASARTLRIFDRLRFKPAGGDPKSGCYPWIENAQSGGPEAGLRSTSRVGHPAGFIQVSTALRLVSRPDGSLQTHRMICGQPRPAS